MKSSTKNRILMLLENNSYPGDIRVRVEAETLQNAGYQVSVISPANGGQSLHETVNGVNIYRYPVIPQFEKALGYLWEYSYAFLATFFLSILVFFRDGFDLLHAHNPPDIFVFIALPYKLFGVRFVFDHHDLSPELFDLRFGKNGQGIIYKILTWFEILSCKAADHIIATNESHKQIEQTRAGIPEERITIVRNGPDLERVRRLAPDPELKKKGKFIIAYVGSIGFQDGVDHFLRTLKHLVFDLHRDDFFSVIIGPGDALESLKQLAKKLEVDPYLSFVGRKSGKQLFHYLSTAHIGVEPAPSNPLNDRSTMIKVMEYMALEIPIVAFDLPENRHTAQSAALFVSPNDEMEFARALVKLMDDENLRNEMGSFGRKRIETQLAWPYSASNLLEVYNKCLPL